MPPDREEIAQMLRHIVDTYEHAGAEVAPLLEAMLWTAYDACARRSGQAAAVDWINTFAEAVRRELEHPGAGKRYIAEADRRMIGRTH